MFYNFVETLGKPSLVYIFAIKMVYDTLLMGKIVIEMSADLK